MKTAKSVSVDELTDAAAGAAKQVMAERLKGLGEGAEIGLFPDIGTIGIWLRDIDLQQVNVAEMMEASASIAEAMGEVARGMEPVVKFTKGGATMGYFPVDPIVLRGLR